MKVLLDFLAIFAAFIVGLVALNVRIYFGTTNDWRDDAFDPIFVGLLFTALAGILFGRLLP